MSLESILGSPVLVAAVLVALIICAVVAAISSRALKEETINFVRAEELSRLRTGGWVGMIASFMLLLVLLFGGW
jgi:hypothetical protein